MTSPPIPTRPCCFCKVPTNETQSVFGIAHYKCFAAAKRKESGNAG